MAVGDAERAVTIMENERYISYDPDGENLVFVPKCIKCGQYVKADKIVWSSGAGLRSGPNATCKKCGRTEMLFQGFI